METGNNGYPEMTPKTYYVCETRTAAGSDLVQRVDLSRTTATRSLNQTRRSEMGQFFTSASVATFMASVIHAPGETVSILDAGAGVGSLFAACVAELCSRERRPTEIMVTAYEVDPSLLPFLEQTVDLCRCQCEAAGVKFSANVRVADFIQETVASLQDGLFAAAGELSYSLAILNPPYRKIRGDSEARRLLRRIGLETGNLYTGFMAAAMQLLSPGAEMVTITPRSFCNGTYFRPFREMFLCEMALRQIHVFESRTEAFQENDVLQETVIVHAMRSRQAPATVKITSSAGADDDLILVHDVPYEQVVHPHDPERFIRAAPDGLSQQIVSHVSLLSCTLADLGVHVSTGRVVDFRAKSFLREQLGEDDAPLVYPVNLDNASVSWPQTTRKPQALAVNDLTRSLLIPRGNYVLVKRFSAKEEKKRISASWLKADTLPGETMALENHINYYHRDGAGLDADLAAGLTLFLNSTLIDSFFRQFNGHTQVNAADLRSLRYPTEAQLKKLGSRVALPPTQQEADRLIEEELFTMADRPEGDPVAAKQKIVEALDILGALGFPKAQLNDRSALTLLALIELKPSAPWRSATQPLYRITPIMEFMEREYGKRYAPNTRETVRRQTMHQFLDAGLVVSNPDKPDRPINSGQYAYQIETSALELLRTYGTNEWDSDLLAYLASVETLKQRYAQERKMARIPIEIAPGQTMTLSPGGQNVLVKQVVAQFAPRFTPGGRLLYVGDADEKFAHFDQNALPALGVEVNAHGKMPYVIIHHTVNNWLVLIEAVTSHGPINPKRKAELQSLFQASTAGLVFMAAFLSRRVMTQYLPDIAWETDVWEAKYPTHMIHFNGERFLGPY